MLSRFDFSRQMWTADKQDFSWYYYNARRFEEEESASEIENHWNNHPEESFDLSNYKDIQNTISSPSTSFLQADTLKNSLKFNLKNAFILW